MVQRIETSAGYFRLARVVLACALAVFSIALTAPANAYAAGQVAASYGVVDGRTVHATAQTRGVRRGARVLLETKRTRRRGAHPVRDVASPRKGTAKLQWKYPRSTKRLAVRVRVVSAGRRPRTLAASRWKTFNVSGLRRAARVAKVKPSTVISAPTPGQPGQVVFNGRTRVRVGEVLVSGFGSATPDGLLAKVTAVQQNGSQTVVTTQPATLPEILPVGELDISLAAGEARASTASPFQRLAKALDCTNQREAVATGGASISAGFKVTAEWRSARSLAVPELTAGFSGDVRARMDAKAYISSEATCILDRQPLFQSAVRLHDFALTIGGVPVYGTVYGQIYLSGEASANGRIETFATGSAGASAGVNYNGETFQPFGKLRKSFTAQPPTVSASGTIGAAVAPAADLRFYGIGGPEIDFTAGLKLHADITPDPGQPWWRLTTPLELGARFRLHAWILNYESDRYSVWREEPELMRATTPPPGSTIQDLGPSPDPLPSGIRTRLTWDSDTDVDLHTWDQDGNHAYFSDTEASPYGFLDRDVIPGYGPETFQETDPGHTFTFGVCQYSGQQANVIVDVRDPDGQTRRFLVSLRGRKGASLITVSPRLATGYLPMEAWCNRTTGDDPTAIGQTTTGFLDQ